MLLLPWRISFPTRPFELVSAQYGRNFFSFKYTSAYRGGEMLMKKLLLISNPSVLGKNLENILKQNYHTDFISTVPKQIGSIPFNSYCL